jgi:desulfoferrodoxin (superoxide reductase-like protein)
MQSFYQRQKRRYDFNNAVDLAVESQFFAVASSPLTSISNCNLYTLFHQHQYGEEFISVT